MRELEERIVSLLGTPSTALTLSEIALRLEKPEKAVFKSLRKLFEEGKVRCVNRQYSLLEK